MSEWLANADLVERLGLGAFIVIGSLWFFNARIWPFWADSAWPFIVSRATATAREREQREEYLRSERVAEREQFFETLATQRSEFRQTLADDRAALSLAIARRDKENHAFLASWETESLRRSDAVAEALDGVTAALTDLKKTGQGATHD